ncbi:MAG TPA: GNAT family N-acetyltransferase [Clostridiales bacterium]|nr:GNAT family N-acetyltransferase [Clostridiales bacterium]
MKFRKSAISDLPGIMEIIRQAQAYMKGNGIDQWQDGYPDANTIVNDINKGCSYVLADNDTLAGTAAVFFDGEKTYNTIYEGEWLTAGSYAAVHRVAVAGSYRNTGAAGYMMECIENLCLSKNVPSIRIDTHEDNLPMRKFLKKCNFQYCGIIYLEDGSKRLAFEKLL